MSPEILLALSVFLACAVEAVEAVTLVLAAGLTRGWRAAGTGSAAATLVLIALIALLGPALARLPIDALRVAVGGLLLVFGLGWLRKAILRAGGLRARHDEDAIFVGQRAALAAAAPSATAIDPAGFLVAFKGVLLEGLEVAFIVVTLGGNAHRIALAALAAGAAVLAVVALALAVRAPLRRIPENALKFAVGVMLSSFGTFYAAEGAGAHWPAGDGAILVLICFIALSSVALVAELRRRPPALAAR